MRRATARATLPAGYRPGDVTERSGRARLSRQVSPGLRRGRRSRRAVRSGQGPSARSVIHLAIGSRHVMATVCYEQSVIN